MTGRIKRGRRSSGSDNSTGGQVHLQWLGTPEANVALQRRSTAEISLNTNARPRKEEGNNNKSARERKLERLGEEVSQG